MLSREIFFVKPETKTQNGNLGNQGWGQVEVGERNPGQGNGGNCESLHRLAETPRRGRSIHLPRRVQSTLLRPWCSLRQRAGTCWRTWTPLSISGDDFCAAHNCPNAAGTGRRKRGGSAPKCARRPFSTQSLTVSRGKQVFVSPLPCKKFHFRNPAKLS